MAKIVMVENCRCDSFSGKSQMLLHVKAWNNNSDKFISAVVLGTPFLRPKNFSPEGCLFIYLLREGAGDHSFSHNVEAGRFYFGHTGL